MTPEEYRKEIKANLALLKIIGLSLSDNEIQQFHTRIYNIYWDFAGKFTHPHDPELKTVNEDLPITSERKVKAKQTLKEWYNQLPKV